MEQWKALQEKANLLRKWCLISTTEAESGHPSSCLSAADLTAVLFNNYFTYETGEPLNLFNDRLVFSKGHAAPLLYALFGMAGAHPLVELKKLRKFYSRLQGHPMPDYVYAEAATGSLGQGLSVGAGLAWLAKKEQRPCKTYVLLGDGELAEGQVWEAANFAGHYQLDNLVAICDINRLAQSGETMFGYQVDQYAARFSAFGFEVLTIDGHNLQEIDHALQTAVSNSNGKPFAIIAKTMKGKGISFIENKDGWHGKALKKDELEKALAELGDIDDGIRFNLKKPVEIKLPAAPTKNAAVDLKFETGKEYATREVFGEAVAALGKTNEAIYVLDGDVKNSTFTEDFLKAWPERFIECFIAEQNMVTVAVGLSRLGKQPVVGTFAAFLTRAADQVRMACISEANIKFVGSHVGVAIGEDGPSQMGLEDIALFGSLPGSVVLQPADAVSTARLLPLMMDHNGIAYMRTLRNKTALLYSQDAEFTIGGSAVLKQHEQDLLTVAASGNTVFEALKAAAELEKENIFIRVVDCYSINPVDKNTLIGCAAATGKRLVIAVEDHFEHGGLGDFIAAALGHQNIRVEKMAVPAVSRSGTMAELLKAAGIDAGSIVAKVKELAAE